MQGALTDARALLQQCSAFHRRHFRHRFEPLAAPAAARHRAPLAATPPCHTQARVPAAAAAAPAAGPAPEPRSESAVVGGRGGDPDNGSGSDDGHASRQQQQPQPEQDNGPGAAFPRQDAPSAAAAAAAAAAAKAQWLRQLPPVTPPGAARPGAQLARPFRPAQPPAGAEGSPPQRLLTWRSAPRSRGGGGSATGAGSGGSSTAATTAAAAATQAPSAAAIVGKPAMPAPRVAALRPAHAADAPPPPPLPLLASHTEDGGEGEGEEEQGGTEDGAGAVLGERRQAEQDEEQEQEQEEGQQQRQSQQQKQQKQKEQQQQQHQEEKQQAQQAQQQQEEARQQRPHGREGTSRLAPRAGAPGAVFSPVFNAAASTQPRALAGALARASEAHRHVLVFAAGPAAVNAAVKALATARGFLRASSGGGLEVLVQPTLRGRAPGADALALDVFFAPAPLALPPGGSGPGNRLVRVTGGSFEAEWARNLVANMPRRGQTVMKVAGAYAVENAVKSVALARGPLGRALGQDLIFVPLWCDEAGFEPPLGPRSPRGRRDGAPKAAWAAAQPAFAAAAAEGRPGGAFQVRPKLRLAVMRCIQGSPLSLVATSKAMPADDAPP